MIKTAFFTIRSLLALAGAVLSVMMAGCADHGPRPTFIINRSVVGKLSSPKPHIKPTLTINVPSLAIIDKQVHTMERGDRVLNVRKGDDNIERPVVEINLAPENPMTNNPGPHHIVVQTTQAGALPEKVSNDDPDTLVLRFKGGYPPKGTTISAQELLKESPPTEFAPPPTSR